MLEDSKVNGDLHQEIGRLIESTAQLRQQVTKLNDRIDEVETKMNTGKGILIGMLLLAAGLGASVSDFLQSLFIH